MKAFRIFRDNPDNVKSTIIIELSFMDLLRLMFGREVCLNQQVSLDEWFYIRSSPAYEAFNLSASHESK